jgi:hypothetical protein
LDRRQAPATVPLKGALDEQIGRSAMGVKLSFSYEQLMGGEVSQVRLQELIEADKLDEVTISRVLHIGRFLAKLENSVPNPDLPVADVLTTAEIQRIWNETADPDADVGRCPMLN